MLCLNMIVRNEMANLERCLGALAPHIDCWVIGDTGSSDGTQAFIETFFAARGLPGELHSFEFRDFEQARNAALDCAAATALDYDYLLLADADMELVVEDPTFRDRLASPGYRLIQRAASGLTYWNTRLVRRNSGARYHGVTHEYIDVPGGVQELHGVWYRDHASGSNRVDKFERDIRLLSEGLKRDPGNHRYWFYLAQSYRDAGQTRKAADAYAKRAEMGGWDEEAWNARLNEARCLLKLGDEGGFLRQALAAFNQRPQRAEPLYDLARFYRERGMFDASMLFCEAGLDLPRPDQDILFLEDFVYTAGLQEEYSIAANYARDPARKDRGFAACNWLALNRTIPDGTRSLARSNLFFYLLPASATMPSFAAHRIDFTPPDGYHSSNPSVALWQGEIVVAQRTVNYSLREDGILTTPHGEPAHTRNFLLRLTDSLKVRRADEILPPTGMPEPVTRLALGFEDLRPFVWLDGLWCSGCALELSKGGRFEQLLARIDTDSIRLTDWRVLRPENPKLDEKNWMPQVVGDELRFIYLCDPTRLVSSDATTISETKPIIAADDFRGGSQAIPFHGGWLALIHEVRFRDKLRFYHHRFVWFDGGNALRKVSRPFFFGKKGIEFAAGLAWHPDTCRLLITYGVDDREAWIAIVDTQDVQHALEPVEQLTSARTTASADEDIAQQEALPHPPAATFPVLPGKPPQKEDEATYLDADTALKAVTVDRTPVIVEKALPAGIAPPATMEPAAPHDTAIRFDEFASASSLPNAAASTKRIGLCMIVKNEAHVITRCLESVRALVDYVLIEDTGSTDGTQAIIRDYLEQNGLPGEVFEHKWRDFAYNRSVALAKLRENSAVDYAFIMDADDLLVFEEGFDVARFKGSLTEDFYTVKVKRATVEFERGHLVSNRRKFLYRGVLHEVLVGPREGYSSAHASGFHIDYRQEGERSLDPEKYRKDAKVLEHALRTEKDPWLRSRYVFYLAQSHFGYNAREKALKRYLERTRMGFWEEEIYWSYFRAAGLKAALGHPLDDVLSTYSKAMRACPRRAEACYYASMACRNARRFAEGYAWAKRGLAIPQPDSGLFVEAWIYEYGLRDEFAVNAYWTERYDECADACEILLRKAKCPDAVRGRIEQNLNFAREKLAAAKVAPLPSSPISLK